ncbi:MAG TPA: oligosaccharide flippase family protein [Polyangiaceae bacterium]|nr:oligosaccharide flippase family protein [Polyangiaceae bacterium]
MPLARDTARGALLTIGSGVGARAIGLLSTLVLARFLTPSEYGEVTVAAVLVMTASQLSTLGFGQFLIANPAAPRSTAFHVTVFHLVSGLLTLGALLLLGRRFGLAFDAPGMTRYLPGLVLAAALDRVGYVPERLLVRELRFGVLSLSRTVADLGYSLASIAFAALGGGAGAIVLGNLVRSAVRAASFVAAVKRREWLEPSPLTARETRALLAFGVPMALGASCSFAARRWDNLLVSHFFGPGPTGAYNLAYNLADVPAIQVGEQIGDVLLPSFARLEPSRRPAALLRSMALLGLVVFPLAVGLGAVAQPLVAVLFDERWRSIGPMLVLLSALSVTRPVGWTVASYLQACGQPVRIFGLEAFKLVCLLGGIVTFGRASPLLACVAVGLAFALHALASLWVIQRSDGVPLRRSIACLLPALLACVPLVAAVLLVRMACDHHVPPLVALVLEIVAGAAGYVAGAWFSAREASEDLLARLMDALRHKRSETV